ncbi:peptidase C14, caspase domain-containing protein [Melanogaster broomeanus]|nr:peptidase C14, caspase domain-containing protein [Melanogaster broomeanus]
MSSSRPTPSAGRKKALLIGVNHCLYESIALVLNRTLARSGYLSKDIVVLLDDNKLPGNRWSTKKNILNRIDLLVKNAVENDQFFVYFSGHGTQVKCRHNTEDDLKDEALLTADGKTILDNVLNEQLVQPLLKTKNVKLFVLFDCCHSATMLDLPHRNRHYGGLSRIFSGFANLFKSSSSSKDIASISCQQRNDVEPAVPLLGLQLHIPRVNTPEEVLEQVAQEVNGSRVVSLSACRDPEQAYDDNERGDTMTKFFIEALTEKYDRTWLELLKEIRRRINELSKRRAEDPSTTINLSQKPQAS